ncbi:hypothetical protein ABEB36_001773 [Hypothenemus hampei]|uniref:Knr4/Smi1-like domain-containing protein n=1 Tax=Hypothenemus hampei TaxID=57062 RepID=A0ABD1FFQ6_HYPHA
MCHNYKIKNSPVSFIHSRNMGFVVDKVSEDSFYENLLLGLAKVLERNPCVSKINLKRIPGVRQVDIRAWEHNNGVILPEDLRSFYASTNGFLFTYEFSYDYQSGSEEDKDFRTGLIEINCLNELGRTFGYETKNTALVQSIGNCHSLTLSRDSKVFELSNVEEAKVVLVYPTTYAIPSIWFYSGQMKFTYLANDFTTYFRMCIAHLGIPCWQFAYSKEGLPEWSREMFNTIAPGVLPEDQNLIQAQNYKYTIEHINKIDTSIFSHSHNDNSSYAAAPLEKTQQQSNLSQMTNRSVKEKQRTKPLTARKSSGYKNKKTL